MPDKQPPYSLKRYLQTAWLPAFQGVSTPCLPELGRTRPWPRYEELRGRLGRAGLQTVSQIDLAELHARTSDCKHLNLARIFGPFNLLHREHYLTCAFFGSDFGTLSDVMMDWEPHTESILMLPNPDWLKLNVVDCDYFCNIENEEQFRGIVEIYVLGTVTEALRLIHRLSRHVPLMKSLEFHNDVSFCNAWRPRWDMLYMVCSVSFSRRGG
jgi:hypothetical protein